MKRRLFKTFVALLAIAAAATGPARAQSNHTKYTSAVAMSALQVGDTLAEGFSLTGEDANFIYLVANRHKHNENLSVYLENISLDQVQSIGANCVFSTLVNEQSITFAPVDENGRDGDAWVVTEVESIAGFTNITIAGIRIPGPPHTVRMAAGTEEAANWSLASGDASVQGTQVLENVMSGSELTATYNGTTKKVKSVKAVKYVPPVLVQSIVLDKQTASLAKDSTMTLSVASVLPENAADKSYTWSSDNTSVAIVNATTGVVTGMAAGTANIIATANDGSGVADTCVVTVLRSVILDGVRVLYASDYGLETWSTVIGYNPGVMYQDGDYVKLTSNGAILCHDGHPVYADDYSYPPFNDCQWLLVANISGIDFYYHQGETWEQAIEANRPNNFMWSIEGGHVKNLMQTLVDSNREPVDPAATIDPSTVNYELWSLDN